MWTVLQSTNLIGIHKKKKKGGKKKKEKKEKNHGNEKLNRVP